MRRFLIIITFFIGIVALKGLSTTHAQTIDPTTWQQQSSGLSFKNGKTAGLGFILENKGWPSLVLQGGVKNTSGNSYIIGPIGIELGLIKIPEITGSVGYTEDVDWSRNELTFSSNSSMLKVWATRLSPALLAYSPSNKLTLFSGDVIGYTLTASKIYSRPLGPAYPKYIAYESGGSIQIQSLGFSDISLSSLDKNWILLWYGNNSHFVETKHPLTYSDANWRRNTPASYAYQADAPMLLVLENKPTSIKQSSEGGVEISFAQSSGHLSILPLYGRDNISVSETGGWSQELPDPVLQKVRWWATHLCSYPTTVLESYSYDELSDTASFKESFNFIDFCGGGTIFAPIPPMLTLAKDDLNIGFSAPLVDGFLTTEFGHTMGIENAKEYTWSVSGLKKYIDSRININANNNEPAELRDKLVLEVEKLLNAGHMVPWIFPDHIPKVNYVGDIYWTNPADIVNHLLSASDILPADTNDRVTQYLRSNYLNSTNPQYNPKTGYSLPLGVGTERTNFTIGNPVIYSQWEQKRSDVFMKRVSLYNLFPLAKYYESTEDSLPSDLIGIAKVLLEQDMQEHDWATLHWYAGYGEREVAVVNANRHAAGLIGFTRLAQTVQDQAAEYLGRTLFAKAATLRVAMAKYPRFIYSSGLEQLPEGADWQPRHTANLWQGHIFNYKWVDANDDVRQVHTLDQFGVFLYDHSGPRKDYEAGLSPYLTPFRDLMPETARLIADYAGGDIQIYIDKVESLIPHWFNAFNEGVFGHEHDLNHPIDSFQIFMVKAWLQQEPPEKLARYADIPWLEAGDLFYIHKLAETIKAYRGWEWSDQGQPTGVPSPTPTHCTPLGDINCSGKVDILDLSALLSSFGSNDAKSDLNNSGKVDILDLSILLSNFGK